VVLVPSVRRREKWNVVVLLLSRACPKLKNKKTTRTAMTNKLTTEMDVNTEGLTALLSG